MAHRRLALGDSHNFGRRVVLAGDRVEKPRTVVWEWLLLAEESPLRRLLSRAGGDAFHFLPALGFSSPRARGGGAVERLKLEPLRIRTKEARRHLARIVGRAIALFSWLGLADLHWENLALGVDRLGRVVFTPLDVEMILADLSLPTETKLLPDADPEYAAISRHAAGIRRVLPYLGKPIGAADLIAIAGAYEKTLALLDAHADAIAAVLARLPELDETPIRVCLRGTDAYVRARSEPVWPPLLDAEAEQLARGDIPYFFRLYGRPGIRYYGDRDLTEQRRLPLRGDVPKLDPLLRLSRGLRSPSRKRLREEGLFALIGAFDHPSFVGRHAGEDVDDIDVTFKARSIVVTLPTGDELSSRRNLGAFVGSVYLPCRCGEVSSVFVPAITRCRA